MPTTITLPSTGEIDFQEIYQTLFGTSAAASNQWDMQQMHDLCGFVGELNIENWYNYKMECRRYEPSSIPVPSSLDFSALPEISTTYDVSILGGDETFDPEVIYIDGTGWISVYTDLINNNYSVGVSSNEGGLSSRSAILRLKHVNNPDIYDDISITQSNTSPTTSPPKTTTAPAVGDITVTLYNIGEMGGTEYDTLQGNLYLKNDLGTIVDTKIINSSGSSLGVTFTGLSAGDYYIDASDIDGFLGGSSHLTIREWKLSSSGSWNIGNFTTIFTLGSTDEFYDFRFYY